MMIEQRTKDERFRVVLGLSAADMTYEEMARYIGVGSRQHVQQLVVNAVSKLPQLAARLGVTGRRQPGRRPIEKHETEVQCKGAASKPGSPYASVRARHIATARQLLDQHGGHYPSATDMLRLGHGALYQFMRKYPSDFERLIHERQTVIRKIHRKHRRRRRF